MLLFTGSLSQCTDGDVRLVGGPASNEGVVEVCINSAWGIVCADIYWGVNDAAVICRQLGYQLHGKLLSSYYICVMLLHINFTGHCINCARLFVQLLWMSIMMKTKNTLVT